MNNPRRGRAMPRVPNQRVPPVLTDEPQTRRLGLGSAVRREYSVRVQGVVLVGVVSVLVTALGYLFWRRNSAVKIALVDGQGLVAAVRVARAKLALAVAPNAPKVEERVHLGPPQKVRCGATPRGEYQGASCDDLPAFETALSRAVQEAQYCAPEEHVGGSINFVLTIDFPMRAVHIFPGASGQWHGKKARPATDCAERALTLPDWAAVKHRYRHYAIAVMATYLPKGTQHP